MVQAVDFEVYVIAPQHIVCCYIEITKYSRQGLVF